MKENSRNSEWLRATSVRRASYEVRETSFPSPWNGVENSLASPRVCRSVASSCDRRAKFQASSRNIANNSLYKRGRRRERTERRQHEKKRGKKERKTDEKIARRSWPGRGLASGIDLRFLVACTMRFDKWISSYSPELMKRRWLDRNSMLDVSVCVCVYQIVIGSTYRIVHSFSTCRFL